MTEQVRCWAFSPSGVRCEKGAGHDDLHAVSVVWSDESTWQPSQKVATTTTGGRDVPIIPVTKDDEALIHTCVACGHSTLVHPGGGGPCEMCDCRALIY